MRASISRTHSPCPIGRVLTMIGKTVGQYQVIDKIGDGGMVRYFCTQGEHDETGTLLYRLLKQTTMTALRHER